MLNRSDNKDLLERDLLLKDEESSNGWIFHTLTSNNYLKKEQIIAKSNPAAKRDLQTLKKMRITDEFLEISLRLKEFNNEVNEIKKQYYDLVFKINNIIHDFPSLGLKGQCIIEEQLSLKNRIRFSFHLK